MAYVTRYTRPGDLVVDLFCQGRTVAQETVSVGRRALLVGINPVLLAIARAELTPIHRDALSVAFTRLADTPKGKTTLQRYICDLYRSACPTCHTLGVAEWFAWDRDGDYPFRKAVRCPRCAAVQTGPTDEADMSLAHRIPPRGLAYYYALDRVAPPDDADPATREQAAQLIALYSPRNLTALMDLCRKVEHLDVTEETMWALNGLLLTCFDLGSSLETYEPADGRSHSRPRTLRLPTQYIERNVWFCLEGELTRLLDNPSPAPCLHAVHFATLLREPDPAYALLPQAARDIHRTIPPSNVPLMFADPPRPDGVFWALSALWSGWLWGPATARPMRPFLSRRRFDWDWHCRVLANALKTVPRLLTPEGYLITLFSDRDRDHPLLTSVCLAAGEAGLRLVSWGYSPEIGYRLIWQRAPGVTLRSTTVIETEACVAHAVEAIHATLEARGEPTAWPIVQAAICEHLNRRGETVQPVSEAIAAIQTAREQAAIVAMEAEQDKDGQSVFWWSAEKPSAILTPPLADRVTQAVGDLLVQQQQWKPQELVIAVYTHFPGPLTPELSLVQACIQSYAQPMGDGEEIHLRPEDNPLKRSAERRQMIAHLAELGARLGFDVDMHGKWDVCWLDPNDGTEVYVFDVSISVALGRHLLFSRSMSKPRSAPGTSPQSEPESTSCPENLFAGRDVTRCLVIPGGRAALVSVKLQRDPRLAKAVEQGHWQFVKFRHLRRLLERDDLDRHAFKTIIGLDPIVEQEVAQIPLF